MAKNNVLLVGGHRKSGTTMLHSLFDSHPDVWVPPHDLNVLYAYYPEWLKPTYSDEQRVQRLRIVVLKDWKAYYQAAGFADEEWMKFEGYFNKNIGDINVANINDVLSFLIEGLWLFASSSASLMVVKETSSEMYVPWIFTDRPNWKFLHLFRDPRDNYAALKAGQESYYSMLGNDLLDTISSTIIRYKMGYKWMQNNIAIFGEARYAKLRFEDLVANTEGEMKKIATWLNIPWNESLLLPSRGGIPFKGNSHEKVEFDKVSSSNVGRWSERISKDEAAIFEFVLSEEMHDLDYKQLGSHHTNPSSAADWYAAMNTKYFFADRFDKK